MAQVYFSKDQKGPEVWTHFSHDSKSQEPQNFEAYLKQPEIQRFLEIIVESPMSSSVIYLYLYQASHSMTKSIFKSEANVAESTSLQR